MEQFHCERGSASGPEDPDPQRGEYLLSRKGPSRRCRSQIGDAGKEEQILKELYAWMVSQFSILFVVSTKIS